MQQVLAQPASGNPDADRDAAMESVTPRCSAAAVQFLVARGVMPVSCATDGRLRAVVTLGERHALHEIRHPDVPVCIVKMPLHESGRRYLAAEGAVLEYLDALPALSGLGPGCRARDDHGSLLAMEHIPDSGQRAATCPPALADALGTLHRNTVHAPPAVARSLPPIFSALNHGRTANPQALSALWTFTADRPSLLAGVGAAAREWQCYSLIHADVKPEHWRLRPGADRRAWCLIDWELARLGDPAWDVGSVVHDYLCDAGADAWDFDGMRVPTEARVFLRRYCTVAGCRVWNRGFGRRIALSVATRFVQTALETLGTGSEWQVPGMVRTAQLIFRDPDYVMRDISDAAGALAA